VTSSECQCCEGDGCVDSGEGVQALLNRQFDTSGDLAGLSGILDAALDSVIVMDDRGRIVEFSKSAELTFGYPREQAVGRELAALIVPPHLRARHRESLARYLATGVGSILGKRIELSAMRADGSEFPVELTVTRAEASNAFVGFIRDLTERTRFEQRLSAQHKVTRLLAEASSLEEVAPQILEAICDTVGWQVGGLWELEAGEVLRCLCLWRSAEVDAEEFERASLQLRFARGVGLPGRVWNSMGPLWVKSIAADPEFPRSAVAGRAGLHGAFAAPILIGSHLRGVIEFFSREVREPDEDLLRMIAAIGSQLGQFIERKQSEEALRRSEQTYRLLFERHPSPMWVYDPDTFRFLAVNDAAVATYGYSRDEFLRMTIADIRPPEDVPALEATRTDAGRGRVEDDTWRHTKSDGTTIDVAIVSDTIYFGDKRARIVLAQDVTEQRRLAEQLRQAQKMEAVGQLAAGIAHDFNNILTVISGANALLLRDIHDQPLRERVRQVGHAAEHAAKLTQQLLAFSRQQVLRPVPTDLNTAVDETLQLVSRVIGEDIQLEPRLEPDIEPIVFDRNQLQQVILNLCVNARDAMPAGGTLTIRTANVELDDASAAAHLDVTPGAYVLLEITDSGVGMDAETKKRIFDPFFTTKETGTGLGLATVYGIVQQSGGNIWLDSEPGKGTSFKVFLPRATRTAESPIAPAATSPLEGNETILLVEDADQLRPLVAQVLESYGYTVIPAANGLEALAIAEEQGESIDLVLTDIVMPQMNGRELAEKLAPTHPELKVLFTSGYPADSIIRQGIAEGRVAYIQKPYLADELAHKIRETLRG
jgi:two-component system, cell cycle sensor histidine kinase and response regulator CckA